MILENGAGKETLTAFKEGRLETGLGLGLPSVDNYLSYKKNNFVVLAGHANVGKTYWLLWYYMMLTIKYGLKFCIYSSENEIWVLKMYLVEFYCKKKLEKITEQDYHHACAFVDEYFKFIDSDRDYELPELLKAFKEVDTDAYMIDPHNSLITPAGVNKHEYDYRMASEIRNFCKTNKKTIYLSAHGVTEALRKVHAKRHECEGLTMPLQAADIEGGGKWVNRCDDLIILHRYTQHPAYWMDTEIHIRKVKVTQTGGSSTMADHPLKFTLHFGSQFNHHEHDIREKVTETKEDENNELQF